MLNRHTEKSSFGSEAYSKEELIAEMASSMLCGYCGIDCERIEENQLAYLRSWLKRLKDDNRFVVSAAQSAQKAVDLVIALSSSNSADESVISVDKAV